MTFIAVSQRIQFISEYQESRDTLDQRWHPLFDLCGITPIIIPNHLDTTKKLCTQLSLKGILLTGGNDSPSRKSVENYLLEFAIQKKLPVLGVCHGMQLIQEFFGVALKKITGHITEKQNILIQDNYSEVNSYHDLGTQETTPELRVWAKASDGIVKAIQHQSLPIVGIMWHPERYDVFQQRDIQIIKKIFAGELMCEQSY